MSSKCCRQSCCYPQRCGCYNRCGNCCGGSGCGGFGGGCGGGFGGYGCGGGIGFWLIWLLLLGGGGCW